MLTLEYLAILRVTQFRVQGIRLITRRTDRACIADLAADPGKQSSIKREGEGGLSQSGASLVDFRDIR